MEEGRKREEKGKKQKKQDRKEDESRFIPWFGKKTEQMASTINQP